MRAQHRNVLFGWNLPTHAVMDSEIPKLLNTHYKAPILAHWVTQHLPQIQEASRAEERYDKQRLGRGTHYMHLDTVLKLLPAVVTARQRTEAIAQSALLSHFGIQRNPDRLSADPKVYERALHLKLTQVWQATSEFASGYKETLLSRIKQSHGQLSRSLKGFFYNVPQQRAERFYRFHNNSLIDLLGTTNHLLQDAMKTLHLTQHYDCPLPFPEYLQARCGPKYIPTTPQKPIQYYDHLHALLELWSDHLATAPDYQPTYERRFFRARKEPFDAYLVRMMVESHMQLFNIGAVLERALKQTHHGPEHVYGQLQRRMTPYLKQRMAAASVLSTEALHEAYTQALHEGLSPPEHWLPAGHTEQLYLALA